MTRYTFGQALDDDDILDIQGREYHLVPIGMRVMKKMLRAQQALKDKVGDKPEDAELGEEEIDMAVDIIVQAVRTEERDALKEHIEDSVGPRLVIQIASAVMSSMSDVDPTQPESSSDGSATDATGSTSTAGAEPAVSTPSI